MHAVGDRWGNFFKRALHFLNACIKHALWRKSRLKLRQNVRYTSRDHVDPIHVDESDPEPESTITIPGNQSFGFIAEEAYEVFPQLVSKLDDEPNDVDYPLLSVALLAEVKKLKERIEVLEGN